MFEKQAARGVGLTAVALLLALCALLLWGTQTSSAGSDQTPPAASPLSGADTSYRTSPSSPPRSEASALRSPPSLDGRMGMLSLLQGVDRTGANVPWRGNDLIASAESAFLQETDQIDPGFTVDLAYDVIWGLVDAGDQVTVSCTADNAYGAAKADGAGFFWTPLWQANGQPAGIAGGDEIEVYVNGGLAATLHPQDVSGGIDVLTDQVEGTISGDTGGTQVTIRVGAEGQPPGQNAPQQTVTTNGSGDFAATFAAVDLGPSMLVAVEYPRDGNTVRAYLYPDPRVLLVQNLVIVRGYADPGQQVNVTCYEGAGPTVRWSAEGTAGAPHGWYEIWAPGSAEAGDLVEVDLGGGQILATTVAALSVTGVDPVLDQVVGTAPPGAVVTLRLWQLGGYAQTTAIAAGNGDVAATFASADLRVRDEFQMSVADAQGDESLLLSGAPSVEVYLDPLSNVDAVYWRVDGPGLPVTLTIETMSGTYTRTGLTSSAGNGSWPYCNVIRDPYGVRVNFSPGDTVTVQSPTWEGSVVIADISWAVDSAADQVSGTAPAGELEVYAYQWHSDQYPVYGSAVQTGSAASSYGVAFPGFDVRDGGWIDVRHFDPTTGFATLSNWLGSLSTQYFDAEILQGGVGGVPPAADEGITAELYDVDGTTLLASTSDDHDGDPWRFWLQFDGYAIEPGRWVKVIGESGWTADLQVPSLTLEMDADTDLIWGEGPKALLFVEHDWPDGSDGRFVPVDGYVLDRAFFGGDVQIGDSASATYQALNGNRAEVRRSLVVPQMGLNYGQDRASGVYAVGHTFWITVTESDGSTVKATATVETEPGGSMHDGGWSDGFVAEGDDWSPSRPDIQPGDWVQFRSDDDYTNAVQAGTISAVLDSAEDTVAGTITVPWLASQTLGAAAGAWGWTWVSFSVDLDVDGNTDYLVDFSPYDLQPGWSVDVKYWEPDGDYVVNTTGLSFARANIAWDAVDGWFGPGAEVSFTVTDAYGAYKGDGSGTAKPDGWMDGVGCGCDMLPGDEVHVTSNAGFDAVLELIDITGHIDVDADVVSGQMSGGVFPGTGNLWVWSDARQEGYGTDFDIDAAGAYSVDLSGQFDIEAGNTAEVWYYDSNGNRPGTQLRTLSVDVNYGHDWVYVGSEPNASVLIEVVGKATLEGETDANGNFYSHWVNEDWDPAPPDIAPGDTVNVAAAGYEASVDPVGTIEGTVSIAADTVAGTIQAPFDQPLRVRCEVWMEGGPGIDVWDVDPDGGSYFCDVGAAGWDVRPGDMLAVRYFEPDGNTVINVFEASGYTIYLPLVLRNH